MLKVAVIGAGTMASTHTEAYVGMPGMELVGISDIRSDMGSALAEQRGTTYYGSLEEMLSKAEPDVVDICVPTYLHLHYTERVAKAKKHVICEKPMARTLEQARRMIEVCEEAGVRLFVGHVVRFFPEFVEARNQVITGQIGQVGTVRSMRGGSFPVATEDWYASIEKSGTLIVDLMIHDFDYLRWCFGEVERVYGKSMFGREFNRMDHAVASLRFQNGIIAHVEGTWAAPSGFHTELEIAGTEGIIRHNSLLEAPVHISLRADESNSAGVNVPESPLQHSPYYLELEHFLDCIRTGKEAVVTPHDAYKALEISLAVLESVQTKQPVTIAHEGDC